MVSRCCNEQVFLVETEYFSYYGCHGCNRPCDLNCVVNDNIAADNLITNDCLAAYC
jgi:hypothetical protein